MKKSFEQKNLITLCFTTNCETRGCFAAAEPVQLTIIESTMISLLYQRVLEEKVRLFLQKMKTEEDVDYTT